MFGMKRRAKDRAVKKAARLETVRQAAHTYLVAELRDTVEWLIASHNLAGRADPLLTKAEAIRQGIDAVLVNGLEAFGRELKDQDQPVRGGAMMAKLLLSGTFNYAEARGDICYMLGFTRDGSVMREQLSEYYRGFQRGKEAGQKLANAVDEMMERLVKPWADDMIDIFAKKVAVKLIFGDDGLALEAESSLAEFNQAVDDHLQTIRPDVRAKLSSSEQLSAELGALDEYKMVLINRFDTLRQNLRKSAIEIAQCVVMARNEEMGLDFEQGGHLTNGRKILKAVRAMPVSLTEDDKKVVKRCLEALG